MKNSTPLQSHKVIRIFAVLLFGLSVGFAFNNCAPAKDSTATDAVVVGGSMKSTVLGEGTYSLGKTFNYKLIKLELPGQQPVFVQWIPNGKTTKSPALVIADPYSGIGWTDQAVDQKWASRPNALSGSQFPDEDGPFFNASTSKTIFYQLSTPGGNNGIASQGAFFLLNDISVLIVHGRFYAGGNLQDHIQAMRAGLEFLASQPEVDSQRIGIYGMSFGGFEALYGAAGAPAQAIPAAGVAVAPLSNFENQVNYIQTILPGAISQPSVLSSYRDFFEPYLRRIFASTGWAQPDFSNYRTSAIAQDLKTPFLIIHDDWDTLVPSQQTKDLKQAREGLVDVYFFPHNSPIDYNTFTRDHQQASEGMTFNGFYPITEVYLLNRLLQPESTKTIFYNNSDFTNSLVYLRQKQLGGADISWLKARLLEFCAPNLQLQDTSSNQKVTGPYYLSVVMSAWGWQESEFTVCSKLKNQNI